MADEKHTHSSGRTDASTLDISIMIRDILRQWWVILLAGIAAAMLCGAVLQFTYSPEYSASTTFIVKRSGVSNNTVVDNLNAADEMRTTFETIVNSSILQNRICRELGLPQLDADIRIQAVESSNLMTLTVRTSNARLTYSVICAVMDIASELCMELSDSILIQTIQPPTVPTGIANGLNLRHYQKRAAIFGAALVALLFAYLSYQSDTVKNELDMKSKVDAKHLGTIWHEYKFKTLPALIRRAKISMRIDNPTLTFRFAESNRLLATRVRRELDKRGAKVLMVTSVSENEGKSTVAANVALSLSREGRKVVLLDCDFYKPAQYRIFDMKKEQIQDNDFGAALRSQTTIRFTPAGLQKKLLAGFTVAPCSSPLRRKDTQYLTHLLDFLREQTDYVVLDSSPFGLISESEELANLADASLLVVAQNRVDSRFINDTIDQLNDTRGQVIGCVLNNAHNGLLQRSSSYGYGYGYGRYGRYGYGYGYGSRSAQAAQESQKNS